MLDCYQTASFGEMSIHGCSLFLLLFWFVDLFLLTYKSSLYILEIYLLSNILFTNIFTIDCQFTLLFAEWRLRNLMHFHLSSFGFVSYAFGVTYKKPFLRSMSRNYFPVF